MRTVYLEYACDINVNDQRAITRITGPEGGEWRASFYNLYTEDDVLEHFAYNHITNGVEHINQLEGWADLADDAVTFGECAVQ